MDPIKEDDLRRSRRMKQYQEYQKHLDNVDKAEGKKSEKKLGSYKGKKVETLTPHEDTKTSSFFHQAINKENKPPS